MKAMTMKTVATMLVTLALASVSSAQTITNIYWTGNGDRWGASPHTKWSLTPGGTDYYQLQGGATVHMHYDRNNMVGTTSTILINRQAVDMRSVTMTGDGGGNGFILNLTSNINNNVAIKLSGPLAVNSGQHAWAREAGAIHNPAAAVFTLAADSAWTIADNAVLLWAIPFTNNSFGIIKEGLGTLAFQGDQFYTGNTAINAGAFGVYGGNASLAGNLSFASGADLLFSDTYTLTVAGTVTFGGFGIADLVGLDSSVAANTYTLINGNVDFTNIGNVGLANAVDIGGGKAAYFQQGSLQLVVVPEPSVFSLAGLGIAGLLLFRRRVRV